VDFHAKFPLRAVISYPGKLEICGQVVENLWRDPADAVGIVAEQMFAGPHHSRDRTAYDAPTRRGSVGIRHAPQHPRERAMFAVH
jgi:hypothetical protein